MNNRSPAYQYYPDKFQSHTRHLSDTSYRIYRDILDWMWLHSADYCSIPNDADFIALVIGRDRNHVTGALSEIQNEHMKLLKEVGKKLVSNGLKKEADKQRKKRQAMSSNAKSRWDKEKELFNCNASAEQKQCPPSPTPSPIPSPTTYKEVSTRLAVRLIDSMERKPITSKQASAKEIVKLLKRGVSEKEIEKTIDWLAGPNRNSEYTYIVESGGALLRKWDRIQAAMCRKNNSPKNKLPPARDMI